MSERVPQLSVVVPAYRCAADLRRCLEALRASDLPRTEWELIVADDDSPDDTSQVAESLADRTVRIAGGPLGPAAARNAGVAAARGELLLFVDADVCVAPTTLRQMHELFASRPTLAAAFGAYDRSPVAPGFVSQYRNLLHHYVHMAGAGPATTFWAGCGAVRRAAFAAVGGYDAARYPRPQIEDVELGYRLTAAGYEIRLHPEIQCTHLKRWTWKGGVITDVRDRGVPWMRLILERGELAAAGPLNLQRREKLLTILTSLGLGLLLLGFLARSIALVSAGLIALAAVILGNLTLLRWFATVRGPGFALRCIPLRLQYYLLNAFSVAWALLRHFTNDRSSAGTFARDTSPSTVKR